MINIWPNRTLKKNRKKKGMYKINDFVFVFFFLKNGWRKRNEGGEELVARRTKQKGREGQQASPSPSPSHRHAS